MLKKIMAVDVILITIFFLTNYLFLILKVDYISSIYFIFITSLGGEIFFPFIVFSLMVIPFIKKYKLFYGILNMIVVYLMLWLTFMWVVSIGIDKYGNTFLKRLKNHIYHRNLDRSTLVTTNIQEFEYCANKNDEFN